VSPTDGMPGTVVLPRAKVVQQLDDDTRWARPSVGLLIGSHRICPHEGARDCFLVTVIVGSSKTNGTFIHKDNFKTIAKCGGAE